MEAELLELLHREADGDLSPAEQEALQAALKDPAVAEARRALAQGVELLRAPVTPPHSVAVAVVAEVTLQRQLSAPPLPRSVARAVAAEVAASAALEPLLASPPLPRSLAAAVSRDIALGRALREAPVPPASSVAPAVLAELRAARVLTPPPLPQSVAVAVASQVRQDAVVRQAFQEAAPPPRPVSVAARLASRISQEAQEQVASALPEAVAAPVPVAPPSPPAVRRRSNPAPLMLVGGLLAGLTLLTVTSAWPNLHAGAVVLQTLLEHVAPLTGLGLVLLVLTSALVTWTPTPPVRRFGAAAFALAGALTLPPLYQVASGGQGLSFGQTVVVRGEVPGNVVSIGGDIKLEPGARVGGQVVALLGDIDQAPGAEVSGETSALLGRAPNEMSSTAPAPQGVGLATAAAFRPLLGWLGAAAWPQIFVTMTGTLLLLLFVAGTAPVLARRQRHAPMQSLALGVLMLSALTIPALALGLSGLLGPALLALALVGLLIATGLSVSVYDAGRALACRLRLPVPDTVGALLGLSAFAASLSWPPLAFVLALIGGAWGAGTLFLWRRQSRA